MSHQNVDVNVNKETLMEPQPHKTESGCGTKLKIIAALVLGMMLIASVALLVVFVATDEDKEETSSPASLSPRTEKPHTSNPVLTTDGPAVDAPPNRFFTPICGPFFMIADPQGVMNITYELGVSSPYNNSAIRISASTTSQGYGAVGFRNLTAAGKGHMFGIDVIAFDRRGVQDRVITSQPGPPGPAPLPTIVTQDQLVVGTLIYARFFRDLYTNSSYDMSLTKGMTLNIAYSLGQGQVGTTWQHHMYAGSRNITLMHC
eukprot:TRINITY_DN541_c0_g1_i1.p1 TRINITY_DN541_c0_g1~~TRINITY_DN541_c0_g1_i1.p1  ORF type:complete len:282 (+),score=59.02 TRINITY_DN541_c0_g1_i1:68-847(+)